MCTRLHSYQNVNPASSASLTKQQEYSTCLCNQVLSPLLKTALVKLDMDTSGLANYRPITNPIQNLFWGNFLRRLYLSNYMIIWILIIWVKFQTGYRTNYSTETTETRISTDSNNVSVLFLMDSGTAFDTINHGILINQLEKWVCLSGAVLDWFRSYLSKRKIFASLGDLVSETFDIEYGVPQGSILGPLFLYTCSLWATYLVTIMSYHCYADDTQLYISVLPDDPSFYRDVHSKQKYYMIITGN